MIGPLQAAGSDWMSSSLFCVAYARIDACCRSLWGCFAISLVNDFASDMIDPLVPLYSASVLRVDRAAAYLASR
jgi:hypothetical protein